MRSAMVFAYLAGLVGYLLHASYSVLPEDEWDGGRVLVGLVLLFLLGRQLEKRIEKRAVELAKRNTGSSASTSDLDGP